jgi:hypothetical protein
METQRDWFYLLPTGEKARDMKEGCQKMEQATGHKWSAESFRTLVRKEVVKKIHNNTNGITKRRDADNNTGAALNY